MAVQGLDRMVAPPAAMAKRMLDQIGGTWWCVYIGGPTALGRGWTAALVREYAQHGIHRFMLTYAGRGFGGPLTRQQGHADAVEALKLAKGYGYSGHFPLCLDIEHRTWESNRAGAVEYARGWCEGVRRAGARPGIYANVDPLKSMGQGGVPADFVWVASWVSHAAGPRDPHAIPKFPDNLWSHRGARAWQYAAEYSNQPCRILGLDVDLNVADPGCLAHTPGHHADETPRVREEHKQKHKQKQKQEQEQEHTRRPVVPKQKHKQPARRVRLGHLVEDFRRLESETNAAWERITAYGERRRRLAAQVDLAQGGEAGALAEIAAILTRMEHTLETLVDVERRELALDEEAQHAREAAAVAEPAAAGEYAAGVGGPGIPTATLTVGEKRANGGGATLAPPSEQQSLVLTELTDNELQHRIAKLEHARGRAQLVLLRRYVRAERELLAAGLHEREPSSGGEQRREPQRRRKAREPRVTRKDQAPTEAVRHLQAAMNQFTRKYLANITPLVEDGKKGPATNKRIRHVKYWLGYSNKERRTASTDPQFLRRVLHPRSPGASSPAMVARGIARRRRQHKLAAASAQSRAGVSTFDGKPVAAWMVPYLDWARANGWKGHLNSGYRTPEYSEHLCMGMCGAVRCPGKCAGRTSNHSQRTSPRGALDVTEYVQFGELMKRCPHSPRIFNNLPADRVHFSSTGG